VSLTRSTLDVAVGGNALVVATLVTPTAGPGGTECVAGEAGFVTLGVSLGVAAGALLRLCHSGPSVSIHLPLTTIWLGRERAKDRSREIMLRRSLGQFHRG